MCWQRSQAAEKPLLQQEQPPSPAGVPAVTPTPALTHLHRLLGAAGHLQAVPSSSDPSGPAAQWLWCWGALRPLRHSMGYPPEPHTSTVPTGLATPTLLLIDLHC